MKLMKTILFTCVLFVVLSCGNQNEDQSKISIKPDVDNGGITLPKNFGALVVADELGRGRHLSVNDNGDVYVHLVKPNEDGKAIIALRDTTGDGKADIVKGFSDVGGTGIKIHNGYLYYASRIEIYRSLLNERTLLPEDNNELMVRMVEGSGHMEKSFDFDEQGNMYVNIGSISNACQEQQRTKGSPGLDPCPELTTRAGIWKFSDNLPDQQQDETLRYATGIRNAIALSWNESTGKLYGVQHGRDDLHRYWPEHYTEEQNLELPAEEFFEIEEGDDFGWPYCYWDQFMSKKLLNPEYGGDGKSTGRCENIKEPLVGFPGHWAPNDLLFYTGNMFPERYREGAFIAFHGSWNRLGHEQAGFNVVFVPMKDGKPIGPWEVFADGFKGEKSINSPGDAEFRPCGLAEGPDGSLYVVDSQKGRVWRIVYFPQGITDHVASGETTEDAEDTGAANNTDVSESRMNAGKIVYNAYCLGCHMENGKGVPGVFPPLFGTDWIDGDNEKLIKVLLDGMDEPVRINGEYYQNVMPSQAFLSDEQIADVLTYVRKSFGNNGASVSAEEVKRLRK